MEPPDGKHQQEAAPQAGEQLQEPADERTEGRLGEPLPGGIKDVATLIQDGLDPVHAVYAFMQQMSTQFAEGVSQMPEMKAYYKAAADAEDTYMPAGPPISPLTGSFFTTWAFYDLRPTGRSQEAQ
jgi:hypothetical protein